MPPRRKRVKVEVIESSFDEEISSESQEDLENFDHWSVPKSQLKTQSFLSITSTLSSPLKDQESILEPPQEHIPWIDKYRPIEVNDICINPMKLKQVKQSLESMINHRSNSKILILCGPSGCCKSTTIKILANELLTKGDLFNSKIIEIGRAHV